MMFTVGLPAVSNGLALDPERGARPAVARTAAHAGPGRSLMPDPAARPRRPGPRALPGDSLTCDHLAAELRRDGHPVRDSRISQLLTALKLESC